PQLRNVSSGSCRFAIVGPPVGIKATPQLGSLGWRPLTHEPIFMMLKITGPTEPYELPIVHSLTMTWRSFMKTISMALLGAAALPMTAGTSSPAWGCERDSPSC